MKTVREQTEDVLGKAVVRVIGLACKGADPPRPVPPGLLNFQVTLKRSVYKDPSLHYFDVRRLYHAMRAEGLLYNVLLPRAPKAPKGYNATPLAAGGGADHRTAPDGGEADVPEVDRAAEAKLMEAEQLQLLDIVSREAEASLQTTGASFLGSVLLQEKKASVKNFSMLRVIGKGSFGKVILAKHNRSDQMYAIKVMEKEIIIEQDAVDRIMSEHNVLLANEAHPFVVSLHYSFQTPLKLYFVLDYVNGGELYFHLNRETKFSTVRSMFYAAELASGLGFLHGLNILYRDLKPENILLDRHGHIMLTDFGLCKEHIPPGGTTSTFCGTPEYLAPEMLNKQPYGRAVDWWCLGCVLYEMIFGLPPFYSQDWSEMYEKILRAPLKFPSQIPPSCKSILDGLLARDPAQRLGGGLDDVVALQKHSFFKSIDWAKLDRREINPPFDPNVSNSMDLKNFDPDVTSEPVPSNIDQETLGLPAPLSPGVIDSATPQQDQHSYGVAGGGGGGGGGGDFSGFTSVGQLET